MNSFVGVIITIWLLFQGVLAINVGLAQVERPAVKFGPSAVFLGFVNILLVVLWWLA